MQLNNIDILIKSLRDEAKKYDYSSKPISLQNTAAYQEILAIGKNALPGLLAELKESPNFWLLYLLRDITEVDVVNDENRGKIYLMAQAWLDWGKTQKLVI